MRGRRISSVKYMLSFRRKREKEGRKEKKKFLNGLRNVYESTRVAQRVFFVSQRYFDKYRRTQKNFRCSFVRSFCDPHPFRILFTVFTFYSFYLCFVPLIPKESYPSICVCFCILNVFVIYINLFSTFFSLMFLSAARHDLHVLDVMQGGLHLFLEQFVFLSLGGKVVCKDHRLEGGCTRT